MTPDSLPETPVEKLAYAIYQSHVAEAKKEIEAIKFDIRDMVDLFGRLRSESQTAQILIFSSYFEEKIKELIKVNLIKIESSASEERLFGNNGPLGTFSNRVVMVFHLGWIRPAIKDKIDAFRKIRNLFAHKAYAVGFENPAIVDQIKRIDYDISQFIEDLNRDNSGEVSISQSALNDSNHTLCKLAFLAHQTFTDLLILPRTNPHRVARSDIVQNYNTAPQNVQNIYLSAAGSMFVALGLDSRAALATLARDDSLGEAQNERHPDLASTAGARADDASRPRPSGIGA